MLRFGLGGLPLGLAGFADLGNKLGLAQGATRGALRPGESTAGADLLGASALLANTITGTDSAETLYGSDGDDVILGLDGIDRIFGFDGRDVIYGGTATDTVFGGNGDDTLFGELGSDSLYGDDGQDTLYGATGSDRLIGGSGNDTAWGGSGADSIAGYDGDDLLSGGAGADRIFGGTGQDTLDYSQSSAGVAVLLNDGFAEKGGDAEGDVIFTVEHLVGSNQGDTLVATAGAAVANTLWGLDGDDTLNGLGGNDWLFGGTGADSLIGDSGNDWLFGGDGNDLSFGGDGDDTFQPGTGIDTVFGAAGNDYFFASAGADRYDDSDGNDVVDYSASPAGVAIITTGDFAAGYGGWATGDTFTGDNANNAVIGSNFDDTITGYDAADSTFANTFLGGLGDDTLMPGSSGFDTLIGGGGSDWASWANLAAPVQADLSTGQGIMGADTTTLSEIENLMGSQANDRLIGNAGVNALRGQDGDDSLHGGAGADSLFGESGNDVVFYDAVDSAIMGAAGRDTLVGTSAADAVQMNAAAFHAGGSFAAFELFNLGEGNDYYLGSSTAADFNLILGAGVTVFGATGNDYIAMRGNNATQGNNDYVSGGVGNDVIWGGGGNDTLFGGGNEDAIYGGFGNDTFYGGAGYDVAYIGRNEGNDVIVDSEGLVLFWGNDALEQGPVYDGVDPSEINIAYGGGKVIITFDTGGTVSFALGAVQTLNLFDYANNNAGNSSAPPPTTHRDVWSAEWDAGSQTFTAFTKVVDG